MKLTSAPLFWKEKTRGVNCSWETWLSRWVLTVFCHVKLLSFQNISGIIVSVSDISKFCLSCLFSILLLSF